MDFVYLNERFILVASEERSIKVTDGKKCQLSRWKTFPMVNSSKEPVNSGSPAGGVQAKPGSIRVSGQAGLLWEKRFSPISKLGTWR